MAPAKVILDLCAGSGSWSEPYVKAGYQVERIDLMRAESLADVRLIGKRNYPIYGILAAPPCTYFCRMRMCQGRPTNEQFLEGLSIVDACLRAVVIYQPQWWALENPQGYLRHWLGDPALKFDPCDYRDPWTKRTWVWGKFQLPKQNPIKPVDSWVRKHVKGTRHQSGIARSSEERSITPPGFAQAFFEANP